jgi:hypothetical protein
MDILIEDAEQLTYLNAKGQWSKTPGEGSGFLSTRAAFATAKNELIGKFNIVQFIALNGQLVNLDTGRGKGKETP